MAPVPQIRDYDRSKGVVFFKTREAFGELSNMSSRFPLRIAGVAVPSSEALYQCCRFPDLPEVQQKIIAQKSPMTAKMVTKPYRHQTRSDWDDARVPIMKWCLRVKLIQNWDEFGKILLKTGDSPIIEQSTKDSFWGAIPDPRNQSLKGANVLGRLLMELRELLRRDPDALCVLDPIPIPNFCLFGQPIRQVGRPHLVYDAEVKVASNSQEALALPTDAASCESESVRAEAKSRQTKRSRVWKFAQQIEMFDPPSPESTQPLQDKQAAYHVRPSQRGGWDVLRDGAKKASNHFEDKNEAINRARELASKHKMELVIHDLSGETQNPKAMQPKSAPKKKAAKRISSRTATANMGS